MTMPRRLRRLEHERIGVAASESAAYRLHAQTPPATKEQRGRWGFGVLAIRTTVTSPAPADTGEDPGT